MNKIICFLTVFSLFFGCISERKRLKICQTCTLNQITKDSIVEKITTKTQTVTVHDSIPYFLPNPCAALCDSIGRLKRFEAVIKSDKGTKLKIYTDSNQIKFKDVLDSLKEKITYKDTCIDKYHEVLKEVPARCDLEHLTKMDSFWIIVGRILLGFNLVFFGWKAYKYYRKFHLPLP